MSTHQVCCHLCIQYAWLSAWSRSSAEETASCSTLPAVRTAQPTCRRMAAAGTAAQLSLCTVRPGRAAAHQARARRQTAESRRASCSCWTKRSWQASRCTSQSEPLNESLVQRLYVLSPACCARPAQRAARPGRREREAEVVLGALLAACGGQRPGGGHADHSAGDRAHADDAHTGGPQVQACQLLLLLVTVLLWRGRSSRQRMLASAPERCQ